ncbi:MAG: Hpt domain-containing protein, partial [Zoogloeaceae bacterium]|nr:Hpt domain-containing protein [Zoogloeaceae bacterium]
PMLAQTPDMDTPYDVGRAAHTIAGISGTVGIKTINVLAHELEAALLRRNESSKKDSLEGQEVIRQTIDILETVQAQMDGGKMPAAQPALIDLLRGIYPSHGEEGIEPEMAAADIELAPLASTLAAVPADIPPFSIAASPTPPTLLVDTMEDEELLAIFLEEAEDIVAGFYSQIAAWRLDKMSESAPHALSRLLHTFKGSARMAGAMNLGEITHTLESQVGRLVARDVISDEALDDIETACDTLAQTVERYRAGNYAIPVLPEFSSPELAPEREIPAAAEKPSLASDLFAPGVATAPPPREEVEEETVEEREEKLTQAISEFSDLPAESMAPPPPPPPLPASSTVLDSPDIEEEVNRKLGLPPLLRDELDEQLLPIFLEEAVDLISGFQQEIAAWRSNRTSEDAPRALARLLHTFKGGARMAGAMNLGELTHATETRVGELMNAGEASDADLDEIASVCDTLGETVQRYQSGDYGAPKLVTPAPAEKTSEAPSPVAERAPETAAASGDAPAPVVSRAVATPAAPRAESESRAQLRVRADLIDRLVNEAGELSIARARIEGEMRELKGSLIDLTENVIRLRRQLREIEIQAETQIQSNTDSGAKIGFDPLELDRFTRFQELTRMMAESVNDVATVQQNLLKTLDDANAAITAQARLNRSLQQSLMSVRMVPFYSQSERLYRLVRQTSKELGKRASLDIQGGQVEMDRSVLEKILSPLEHMLRNSVAHGVEMRAERLKAGKPEIGEITLSITQEGNEIILSLSDDGSGLDASRIRLKAESAGLLVPGQEVDDQELLNFIFASGFSTASSVSRVAGRGVGLDVVKTEVGALGGRIEIINRPGQGATFRLYLPLTLAVTQVVLIQAGGKLLAIPSAMVEQVMEIREHNLTEMQSKGEAVWQGNHYPFHYLPRLLGDETSMPEQRRLYWVMLLRSGTQRVGVLIDEMHGNQEIVVKNVGPQMARVVGISGATVLGDGKIVLILNPVALSTRLSSLGSSILAAARQQEAQVVEEEAPRQPMVMVVDDSLTVRKITSRLLAREGYQVVLAKDGVDALEQLIETVPDVILSDIEMPRMDG